MLWCYRRFPFSRLQLILLRPRSGWSAQRTCCSASSTSSVAFCCDPVVGQTSARPQSTSSSSSSSSSSLPLLRSCRGQRRLLFETPFWIWQAFVSGGHSSSIPALLLRRRASRSDLCRAPNTITEPRSLRPNTSDNSSDDHDHAATRAALQTAADAMLAPPQTQAAESVAIIGTAGMLPSSVRTGPDRGCGCGSGCGCG